MRSSQELWEAVGPGGARTFPVSCIVPEVTACLLVYIDARYVLEEDADLEAIPESGAVY
jgi:hypothetical protein